MKAFVLAISFLLLIGCDETSDEEYRRDNIREITLREPPPIDPYNSSSGIAERETVFEEASIFSGQKPQAREERKIIKRGDMEIRSKSIGRSKKSLDTIVAALGGYYETESLERQSELVRYELKIRVPASQFDRLIQRIEKGTGEIVGKNITTANVTEVYTDIKMRLASKRAFLKRYYELLSKAVSVKDVLAIEENIRVLEEEIESKEGRLRFLNNQIAYSALDINLYQRRTLVREEESFWQKVTHSFADGWEGLISLLLAAIVLWPFFIGAALFAFVLRRVVRIFRRGKTVSAKKA